MTIQLEYDIDKIAYGLYLIYCKKNQNWGPTFIFEDYVYIKSQMKNYTSEYDKKIIVDNYNKANIILRKMKLEKLENDNR